MSASDAVTGRPGPALLLRLAPFFCLSVTFGATLGFLGSGAPLILRVRGIELADVGLLQLINLPVGLTFLWAGVVDRFRLPRLPHRLGWIVGMQALGIALLAVLSFGEAWPLPALFGLALAVFFCLATMDVALEALVVETVAPERRPTVTSAKLGGASLGGIVGAGVLIAAYDRLGWQAVVLTVAGLNALCLLPILFYPETALRRRSSDAARKKLDFARLRRLGGRVGVLGLYFAALFALTSVNGFALTDLGVPLAQVGLVTISLSAGINLVMALVAGLLVRRFGLVPLVTLSALGVGAAGLAMLVACAAGSGGLGIAAATFGTLAAGGLGVPVFTMIYRWAEGPQPATDYALLFGAAFFTAMPWRVAAPALAGVVGWPTYFALCLPFFGVAVWLLRRAITRTLEADQVAAKAAAMAAT
ncbi:MFS transporter [Methylorubrum salsuginis]|uniref:Major Facilitator Superfamily protein n=1 Tax=Methylorubrum salsuginis TaxID=414703 RepID=A0A1I4K761_9HYPH|nr:MFS transporter [Methylorubrum salsuginis]SFL74363.1 Major Facilitator Superfamily protein [Methylorubrum salsuginis]